MFDFNKHFKCFNYGEIVNRDKAIRCFQYWTQCKSIFCANDADNDCQFPDGKLIGLILLKYRNIDS